MSRIQHQVQVIQATVSQYHLLDVCFPEDSDSEDTDIITVDLEHLEHLDSLPETDVWWLTRTRLLCEVLYVLRYPSWDGWNCVKEGVVIMKLFKLLKFPVKAPDISRMSVKERPWTCTWQYVNNTIVILNMKSLHNSRSKGLSACFPSLSALHTRLNLSMALLACILFREQQSRAL